MKRIWMHVVGGLAAMVAAGTFAPACAHDDSSFFIDGVLAPPQSTQGACTFTAQPTQPMISIGVLDVDAVYAFANAYYAIFLVANQLIPEGNQQLVMSETSRIIVAGGVVTITLADGTVLSNFSSPAAVEVDPSAGDVPGYSPIEMEIVDPGTITTLRNMLKPFQRETILTYTYAYGQTLGGSHVESNTFEFPITVCRGCLIGYDTLASSNASVPNCYGPAAMSSSSQTPCFYGQEIPFDCHLCYGMVEPDGTQFCQCPKGNCSIVNLPDGGGAPDAGGGGG